MQRRSISAEDKRRLVRAYRNLEDYLALADQLDIKRSSARNIVSKAMRTENPEDIQETRRGGRHHVKVDAEMREVISEAIGRNPAITLKLLNSDLREKLPHKPFIHENYLSSVCKGMFYTLKKLEVSPAERNRDDVKEKRKEYARWYVEVVITSPRVIFIDEAGYNVWTQRTRGRALIGQSAVRTINGQRGQNVTLILAISPQNGIEHHTFNVGGTTADIFQSFFSVLSNKVGLNNQCIFILDNAPCHRSLLALSDNHTVKFLPPYSPMLTPIEHSFSAWKWSVKNKLSEPSVQTSFSSSSDASSHDMSLTQWRRHLLINFGESSLNVITRDKCFNWNNHCMSYFGKCMALEDILF